MLLFFSQWIATVIALWASTYLFSGLKFDSFSALVVSALVLGLANSIIKPILVLFTLPLTVFSFGLFLLVINGLVLMLVSSLVQGFTLQGFWTAVFASVFISIVTLVINTAMVGDFSITKVNKGPWI
jgi:putative membrane protein